MRYYIVIKYSLKKERKLYTLFDFDLMDSKITSGFVYEILKITRTFEIENDEIEKRKRNIQAQSDPIQITHKINYYCCNEHARYKRRRNAP